MAQDDEVKPALLGIGDDGLGRVAPARVDRDQDLLFGSQGLDLPGPFQEEGGS